MKTLGNIIWLIFGGLFSSISWLFLGIVWCVTIIGIPIGLQCFKFAGLVLWPFGKDIEYTNSTGKIFLNVLWILFGGLEMALFEFVLGILFCITIIGIPFGKQYFKMGKLAFMPLGAKVVKK